MPNISPEARALSFCVEHHLGGNVQADLALQLRYAYRDGAEDLAADVRTQSLEVSRLIAEGRADADDRFYKGMQAAFDAVLRVIAHNAEVDYAG